MAEARKRRVLVLGGTGFIGWHAVRQFLARDYEVTVLALPPLPGNNLLPAEVRIVLKGLDALTDPEIEELLRGQDAAIFAAGADDRVLARRPAYEMFHNANVRAAARFFTLARKAGVRRGVLLSSYFAHFSRVWPELKLAQHHPYIRSRVEQEAAALDAAMPGLELVILELPYIFGAVPGRKPLWQPLVRYVRNTPILFYTRGGTNMVAVEHVAEAIVGAVERGKAGETYLVGDENLTWVEFLARLSRLTGKGKRVVTVPDWLVKTGLWLVRELHALQGREGGLDPVELLKLQTAETFFDPEPASHALEFKRGGLEQALAATVRACLSGAEDS